MNKGYIAAFGAYFFWGLSPLYWKIISTIPALEVLGVRVFWAIPYIFLVFLLKKNFRLFASLLKSPRKYKIYFVSAMLLMTNWFVWIWSINNDYILDASLGYFINPLLNVLLGVVFLKEHLKKFQWISLFLALTGVLYLAFNYGKFPWIALTLAGTFALYGYIRKTASLGAFHGLSMEVLYMVIPASLLLFILNNQTDITLFSLNFEMHLWLSLTGIITVVPLLTFAYGARRIPYSTLGFIQYVAPTCQFLLGRFVYGEHFNADRLIGFSFIWLALLIFTYGNFLLLRKRMRLKPV
jgi:chloramphenicol-sensitive protein RarD